jgi:hypothetical protein
MYNKLIEGHISFEITEINMLNKFRLFCTVIFLLVIIASCSPVKTPEEITPTSGTNEKKPTYLGQTPPGLTPQVFAPEIVSADSTFEFAAAFSPDGTEFYFTRRTDNGDSKILETHLQNGSWSVPAVVPFSVGINTFEPNITADNKILYFGQIVENKSSIWAVDRTTNGWSEPRFVGEGMFVSSDQNGQVYITNHVSDNPSISKVAVVDKHFTDYDDIAPGVHPAIAPDGSYLVSDNGNDLLRVRFLTNDEKWGTPKDLSKVGIPTTASVGYISPDGKYFFFTDKQDLYWVSTEIFKNLK